MWSSSALRIVRRLRLLGGGHAAAGTSTRRFSGDGKQTTDFGVGSARRAAIVRQPDGKIVAVGRVGGGPARPTSRSPATTRTARSTRASPATASRRPTSAGDDAGDRGGAPGGRQDRRGRPRWRRHGSDFALARYNPNGSLDPSFSGDGKQTTNFGGSTEANGVALQARRQDRRGRPRWPASGDFALARYNPNGSLDPSFSGDGRQTTDFGGSRRGERGGAPGRRQDRRGRRRSGAGDADFALARYNPNGSLDPSFSGDGKQTTDFRGLRRGDGGGAPGRRQDRRGRRPRGGCGERLRARPLQPQRLARPELLRRRQADDRLRGSTTWRTGWRSRATARSSRSARRRSRRLRARPLQPQRDARPELLRRRQADDRLRRLRRGERGGAPGRRQDRRGRHCRARPGTISRWPAIWEADQGAG